MAINKHNGKEIMEKDKEVKSGNLTEEFLRDWIKENEFYMKEMERIYGKDHDLIAKYRLRIRMLVELLNKYGKKN